jgi:preprotein translocase subunit YajC
MRRRQRKLDKLLADLKSGDRVVTNAGVIGVLTGLTAATVTLRVKPDNVKIEFARSAVNGIAEEEEKA